MSEIHSIFISHATEDAEIASALKKFLNDAFNGISIFVSSRNGIDIGEDPFDRIHAELEKAEILISLLSRNSYDKKWIHTEFFQVGKKDITLIPLFFDGLEVSELPSLITRVQVKNACDERELLNAMSSIGKKINSHIRDASLSDLLQAFSNFNSSVKNIDTRAKNPVVTGTPILDSKLSDEVPKTIAQLSGIHVFDETDRMGCINRAMSYPTEEFNRSSARRGAYTHPTSYADYKPLNLEDRENFTLEDLNTLFTNKSPHYKEVQMIEIGDLTPQQKGVLKLFPNWNTMLSVGVIGRSIIESLVELGIVTWYLKLNTRQTFRIQSHILDLIKEVPSLLDGADPNVDAFIEIYSTPFKVF